MEKYHLEQQKWGLLWYKKLKLKPRQIKSKNHNSYSSRNVLKQFNYATNLTIFF
jgi:hypothetical protein